MKVFLRVYSSSLNSSYGTIPCQISNKPHYEMTLSDLQNEISKQLAT